MITRASTSEEFSFPIMMSNPLANLMLSSSITTKGSASFSLSSSSWWRVNSSRIFHHHEDYDAIDEEEEEDDDELEVRSMCEGLFPICRRGLQRASFQSGEIEMEERMDYLWEDFNEEVVEKENVGEVKISKEICVLQGTKMGRRPTTSHGMLVMGKLLKGLFSFRRKPTKAKSMKQRW